jgi:hemoglobin-like flavoprotein
MTPEQIVLVEQSLSSLRPRIDDLARDFYRRLFAADPALEAMFTTDPAVQRMKFALELDEIGHSIRSHGDFLTRAHDLGVRHAGYGARSAHYRTVQGALLAALAAAVGQDAWTPELEEAWRLAYNLIAEAMMAGAAASAQVG